MTGGHDRQGDRRESFKAATAAALRALSRKRDITVRYAADGGLPPASGKEQDKSQILPLPDPELSAQSTALVRGSADTKALRLRHHSDDIHFQNAPLDLTAKAVFDAMEQARYEALGIRRMKGVARNLGDMLAGKCQKMGLDHINSRESTNMADALYILTRLELSGENPPETQKLRQIWEPWLFEKLGKNGLSALTPMIGDQHAFAAQAREMLVQMALLAPDDGQRSAPEAEQDTAPPPPDEQHGTPDENRPDKQNPADTQQQDQSGEDDDGGTDNDTPFMPMDDDEQGASGHDDDTDGDEQNPRAERPEGYIPGPDDHYKIYTALFDEVIHAEDLAEPEELERLRSMLDRQLSHMQSITTKLANRLQRKLMARQQRSWSFDLEEGTLDTSRLARMIANPDIPLVYKQEQEMPFRDTVVSLLIDNSGSMRGRPIAIAAMCTDILARTLERCGVKVEILGFTTRAWKGGKARDLWIQNNRPLYPGRLNDLRHIIYKSADMPWRRTRRNLGLMLKEGLLKENIDGEALVWAYNRLAARPEQRKIIMVISDGAPVDDSTLSVNPSNILEHDLRTIIAWIENHSPVELTAIGIGHDVTRYYEKATTIADADELAAALIGSISNLFDDSPQKKI